MIDAGICPFFQAVGTVEGDAESGRFDHFDIVGPVADREHVGRRQAFFLAQAPQGIQFRGSPEDRPQNLPRQFPVLKRQLVSLMVVKADAFGDAAGEKGETAGHQDAERPVMAHGLNERPPARFQRDAFLIDAFQQAAVHSYHQCQAFAQGIGKAYVAADDGRRDLPDLRSNADSIAQFVNALLVDDRGVHVGNEKFPSPPLDGRTHRVDRRPGQGIAGLFGYVDGGKEGVDEKIASLPFRQPARFACRRQALINPFNMNGFQGH